MTFCPENCVFLNGVCYPHPLQLRKTKDGILAGKPCFPKGVSYLRPQQLRVRKTKDGILAGKLGFPKGVCGDIVLFHIQE